MAHFVKAFQKSFIYIFLAVFLFSSFLPVFGEEENMSNFVEPILSPSAPDYDAAHPEDLTPDQIYATSAILIEANSGTVIFEKNPDEPMNPSSTTKILTVYLASIIGQQEGLLEQKVVASDSALTIPEDSSTIPLQVGEEINYKDLLYATMIRSGNEGANMLAEAAAGSIDNFIDMMNDYAVNVLSLKNTHFSNTHGYPDTYHVTSARDMAAIARQAMTDELFRTISKTTSYPLPQSNMKRSRTLNANRYRFLEADSDNKYYYPDGIGIKTGTAFRSGYCFVGAAERDGITLISVVFYSGYYNRWTDTIKMMDYGFSQYQSTTPVDLYNENPLYVNLSGYSTDDTDLGRVLLDIVPEESDNIPTIIAPKKELEYLSERLYDIVLVEYEDLVAPVNAGQKLGTLYYIEENGNTSAYQLVASRSVAKRENAPKTLAQIEEETYADPNPFPPLTLEVVLFILLVLFVIFLLIRGLLRLIGTLPKKRNKLPKRQTRRYH